MDRIINPHLVEQCQKLSTGKHLKIVNRNQVKSLIERIGQAEIS
jgi:hypothetical protein